MGSVSGLGALMGLGGGLGRANCNMVLFTRAKNLPYCIDLPFNAKKSTLVTFSSVFCQIFEREIRDVDTHICSW